MSGPVTRSDVEPTAVSAVGGSPVVEITDSREAEVAGLRVRRALPRRTRRTVGAWCFVDHMGPVPVTEDGGVDVAPHPHVGLQTVTWLVSGEAVHRDSLGTEQVIRPGQLNLMTAGQGIAHSEESTQRYRGDLHGVQLWVAQPEATRHGAPSFEHHAELPRLDLGDGEATVLVGALAGASSTARRDTDHLGVDLVVGRGAVVVPLRVEYEHAVVVLEGAIEVEGRPVVPGRLAYLGTGRDELTVAAGDAARLLLIGGVPFPEPVVMWWNFVARSRDEVADARAAWEAESERFGAVPSGLPRIPAPALPWGRQPPAGT